MGISERNVEHGLERIDPERTIELPLRDALYAYKAIGEFIRFFHQPGHWNSAEDIERFIGNDREGGLHVLCEVYYRRLYDVWPSDIDEAFDEGWFDPPFPFPDPDAT